jgi:PAS domain-containing protein
MVSVKFLVWHTGLKLLTVVIALLMAITGCRAILSSRKRPVALLGITFSGVGLFDFLHAMSDSGMPDLFATYTPQMSIFFWLAARLLAVTALLSYVSLVLSGDSTHDGGALIGHRFKTASYVYLLHATFSEALRRPLKLLRRQHRPEKVVLNAAPDSVIWVNENSQFLMTNPAMAQLNEYPFNTLTRQNVDLFLPAHLRAMRHPCDATF